MGYEKLMELSKGIAEEPIKEKGQGDMILDTVPEDVLKQAELVIAVVETKDIVNKEFLLAASEVSRWIITHQEIDFETRVLASPPLFWDKEHFMQLACKAVGWDYTSETGKKLFYLAWSDGHANGYHEVWLQMEALSELANVAFQEGRHS